MWKESMAYEIFCMLVQCVVSHTGNNHIKCIVLEYNKMMFWPVTTLVHVSHANVGMIQPICVPDGNHPVTSLSIALLIAYSS